MGLSVGDWDTIVGIVRAAGRDCVLPRFRNLGADDVSAKSAPDDLVTLADTEAEAAMCAALRTAFPDAAVVGEEAIAADPPLRALIGTAPRCIVLDPIDGTWNFAKGLATFGMILAVVDEGRPVAGLLYDPVLDDWIMADDGSDATLVRADGRSQRLTTSAQSDPAVVTGYVGTALLPPEVRGRVAAALADMPRTSTLRCACHEYRMVAQGHAEFALSGPQPHAWDHAAGSLIVRRAGGVSQMLDGTPYHAGITTGHVLTAGNTAIWDSVAERLRFLTEVP